MVSDTIFTRLYTRLKQGIVFILLGLCALLFACTVPQKTSEQIIAPTQLEVGEGFTNPLGYYEDKPRFSWVLPAQNTSTKQTAYRIQVASSPTFSEKSRVWDSQKIVSNENAWIRYNGKALQSKQKVYWRVRYWDQDNTASNWSQTQHVELGLLSQKDWQAKWIGHPDTHPSKKPSKATLATAQYLRKTFDAKKSIKQARLYITAKGLFEPYINGKKVGNNVMTPGWTPYAKRIETLTYDVTTMINEGQNALAASLAGGWYAGRVADIKKIDHTKPARLLAQLEITYNDGQTQTIVSDNTWQATLNGPIVFASNYDGEHYNQHNEMPNWNNVGFNAQTWQPTLDEKLDDAVKLSPKRHTAAINAQTLPAIKLVSHKNGKAIFDFGQNMVGVPHLKLPVIADQKITVRYAEALHKGEFYTDNYRSAESINMYTPSKTGSIEYRPTFTFHGFRYIEISGFDTNQTPQLSWATGIVRHSDFNVHASFSSSHSKLNQLAENVVWGLKGNFLDIPTDCPQRDERMGWTGDAQVFATPSMYMADVYGFWAAWLESMREEQTENGWIPLYVPYVKWLNFASSGWGDAATVIPWELYVLTGDKTILEDNYAMMQNWLNYHASQSKNNISKMMTFGDWLQPFPARQDKRKNRGDTDFDLISTAYHARSIELTLKAAQALGKTDDMADLQKRHNAIKAVFRDTFFDKNLNLLTEHTTQTSYLLPIAFGLFNNSDKKLAEQKVVDLIKQADTHLRTGFLGTPLLTQVLQNAGKSDLMYELLFQESYPSWFYSINNGATTTWERWNSYSLEDGFNSEGMNSLNHYAYGTVSRWFYEGILGINPAKPGFKHVRIEPQFNARLTQASGQYATPQGKVAVDWSVTHGKLTLKVIVPNNTQADIVLPTQAYKGLMLKNTIVTSPSRLRNLYAGTYTVTAPLSL